MQSLTIEPLLQLAGRRQAELDGAMADWLQGLGSHVRLWCGPGCGNCCTLTVNTTFPEALAIAGSLDDDQRRTLEGTVERVVAHASRCDDARSFLSGYRQAVGPCPFLATDANCTIYTRRPLACRALLSTRPPDWCGINLAELDPFERDAFLASLDRDLVAFPTHYAAAPQELAAGIERGLLFAMIRFAGFGLTGNLPILSWLAGQPEGLAAVAEGSRAVQAFLCRHQVDTPFLVQMHIP